MKCGQAINGNFCDNCGHPRELKRINGKYIVSEIGSLLNFEKGIFYTFKELTLRPGENVRNFLLYDRNRLVKPITFIIITSLIYTLAQNYFNFYDGYINYNSSGMEKSAITKMFSWISANYGYSNLLMAVFIAFWIKIFYRKYKYNFFEILILLCFIMGIGMLILTIFGVIDGITKLKTLDLASIISFLYISWAIGQFFDKKKKMNYLKALLSYLLGMATFSLTFVIIGAFIDIFSK